MVCELGSAVPNSSEFCCELHHFTFANKAVSPIRSSCAVNVLLPRGKF